MHTRDRVTQIADSAQDIAARAEAIENVVTEGMANDNRIFRRRNRILIDLLVVLILITMSSEFRLRYVVEPRAERTAEQVEELQRANAGISELLGFVRDAQDAPPGVTTDELRQVFAVVYEIRLLLCSLDDPIRADACRNLVAREHADDEIVPNPVSP